MARFTIWIAQPKQWPYMRMFLEVVHALAYALRELRHEVAFDPGRGVHVENPLPFPGGRSFGRLIVLGSHFFCDTPLPEDAILYNFEQVPGKLGSAPGSVDGAVIDEWLRSDGVKLLRRHTVWDYSRTNLARLQLLGVEDVHYCGVGYAPVLNRIPAASQEDIDVLFYGSLAPGTRRMKLLEALDGVYIRDGDGAPRPIRLTALSGIFGEERDRRIARAKVVLNVHNNNHEIAPAIFEIVRCSYLFANRKCVVSEGGGQDPELEVFAARATALVPYEKLAETCLSLVDEGLGGEVEGVPMTASSAREAIAKRGFMAFQEIDQVEEVRRALAESGS